MQKTYEGWGSFSSSKQRVVVDWSCPHCNSSNVTMEEDEEFKNARWCDGNMTTHDGFGKWTCNDCGRVERGHRMIQREHSREKIEEPVVERKSVFDSLMNPTKAHE